MDHLVNVQRCADGAIDFDFYRRRAQRQRRQARRDLLKRGIAALLRSLSDAIAEAKRLALRPAPPLTTCCVTAQRRCCI